ncbi:hypothetical protein [Xanthomonas albilineans]|uniref:hypothetical protein n=1 Tax=Xanthomonas albilineans TaxID=29447 RepID=UPI0005F35BBA|nr:hypothetical protein [Xanthomonas albilineans]
MGIRRFTAVAVAVAVGVGVGVGVQHGMLALKPRAGHEELRAVNARVLARNMIDTAMAGTGVLEGSDQRAS